MLKKIILVLASMMMLSAAPAQAAGDMTKWGKAVGKKIAKSHVYPRSAIARELEGSAKVRITVANDGTITKHEIVVGSGHDILDRVIPKIIKRMSPLPALPNEKAEMAMVLPLTWAIE